MWLVIVFAVAWMAGFLTWAAAGGTVPVVGLLGGSLAARRPARLRRPRRRARRARGRGQHRHRRPAALRRLRRRHGRLAGRLTWAGLGAAMVAGLLVASVLGLFAITLLRRPGDRRRRAQRAGHRPDQLHVQPGTGAQRRDPQLAAPVPGGADPGPGRHPADRPDLLPADRDRLHPLHHGRRWSPGRSTAPSGACASARSASTPRPPTRSASRSTAPASARSCSPAPSPAWAARSTPWSRCRSSTGR